MFVKTYEPSSYVKYLFEVQSRITLDDFDEAQYKRLYSGYIGEKQFYERIKNCDGTKLWDLRLDYHGEVQYDFLVIHDGYLFHFDIKNFSGHYSFFLGIIHLLITTLSVNRTMLLKILYHNLRERILN